MGDHDCVCDVPVHRWDYDLCKECGRTISDPFLNQIATLEAALATATEAAEAARSQLAAAEKIVHLVRTFNCCDGDDAHRTAECVGALNEYDALAKLRAAKEGPPMFAPCLACGERHGQFISCDRARQEKR